MLIKYNNHLLIKLNHKNHIDICFTIDYYAKIMFIEYKRTYFIKYYNFMGELCTILFYKIGRKEKFYVSNGSDEKYKINLHKYKSKFIKFKCKLRNICL